MSRWQTEFNQHPFQQSWNALQLETALLSVDDQTIQTSLDEVARLKKVIGYLKPLIDGVDAEITPKSIWESFQQQTEQCLTQIRAYESNRNIGHIQNANLNADNLLTYVKPYMVLPETTVTALSNATKAYQEQIDQFMNSVRDQSNDVVAAIQKNFSLIDDLSKSAKSNAVAIDELKILLLDGSSVDDSIQKKILDLRNAVATQSEEVEAYHNKLLVGGKVRSTKALLDAAVTNIESENERISKLLLNTTEQVANLDAFNSKIFGKVDQDGKLLGGLAQEIETRTSQLLKFEIDQDQKHLALFQKIEGLLPGATSAGLASAYRALKESFDRKIKINTQIFYGAVVTLPLIAFIAAIESFSASPLIISFANVSTFEAILRLSLLKLPIIVPIVWLAIFASMRRSQYERLQQEYSHKEAIAASYENYKKQLDTLQVADVDTLKKDLIAKAIDAISFNASTTLNGPHAEKLPMEHALEMVMSEKVLGSLEKFKGLFKT